MRNVIPVVVCLLYGCTSPNPALNEGLSTNCFRGLMIPGCDIGTEPDDLSSPPDLTELPDLLQPDDLTVPPDLAAPQDMTFVVMNDLSHPADMATTADLSSPPDLTTPPDLLPPPDMTQKPPVRVLSLGDSTTWGNNGNGLQVTWRKAFWDDVTAAGYSIDFVGSQASGDSTLPDHDNEGHPGWKTYDYLQLAGSFAWKPSTVYAKGALVTNDSNRQYQCLTAGTSAASGGPTGTGNNIADGTAVWEYEGAPGFHSHGYLYTKAAKPDAIIVPIGLNDCGAGIKAGGWHMPSVPEAMINMIHQVAEAAPNALIILSEITFLPAGSPGYPAPGTTEYYPLGHQCVVDANARLGAVESYLRAQGINVRIAHSTLTQGDVCPPGGAGGYAGGIGADCIHPSINIGYPRMGHDLSSAFLQWMPPQ